MGLAGNVFSHSYAKFGFLATPSWITSTWQFISKYGLSLHGSLPNLELLQEGDQFLIQAFYDSGIQGQDLAAINHCHLFLQVLVLSDITNGSGGILAT